MVGKFNGDGFMGCGMEVLVKLTYYLKFHGKMEVQKTPIRKSDAGLLLFEVM